MPDLAPADLEAGAGEGTRGLSRQEESKSHNGFAGAIGVSGHAFKDGKGKRGDAVHGAYEDTMLRQNSVQPLSPLMTRLKRPPRIVAPHTGKEAATRVNSGLGSKQKPSR